MGIKILDKINAEQTAKLAEKNFPEFKAGDIVRVSIRVREGEKTRLQDFEGISQITNIPAGASKTPTGIDYHVFSVCNL